MESIYSLFVDNGDGSYKTRDDGKFVEFIYGLVVDSNYTLAGNLIKLKNKFVFETEDIKELEGVVSSINESDELEDELASGNPVVDEKGYVKLGIYAELYKRVINQAIVGRATEKYPFTLEALSKFKKDYFTEEEGISSEFKRNFIKKRKLPFVSKRKYLKEENIDVIMEEVYSQVFEALENYCRNSANLQISGPRKIQTVKTHN